MSVAPQVLWVLAVCKDSGEMLERLVRWGFKVFRVSLAVLDRWVNRVHLVLLEQLVLLVSVASKASRVHLGCVVLQELLDLLDQLDCVARLDPKVLKESRDQLVSREILDHRVSKVILVLSVLLVLQELLECRARMVRMVKQELLDPEEIVDPKVFVASLVLLAHRD